MSRTARSRRSAVLRPGSRTPKTAIPAFLLLTGLWFVPAEASEKKGGETASGPADVPSDDIFGFTSATGLGDKGDIGFANELNGFRGKRSGSYLALSNKTELGYTFAENWWVAGSTFVTHHRIRAVPDLDDLGSTDFEGLGFEIKHRLIQRNALNPFAVTLAVEPVRSWIDLASGQRSDSYSATFKILVDAVIVPDKLFWAANAEWTPQRAQDPDDRSRWLTSSESLLSTALAIQLSPALFVGAEVRHLAVYDGGWLQDRVGYALYAGPTLLWKITDKIVFNATWQPQITGKSMDHPDLRYDLDNFERAQFRAKLSVALN